MEADAEDVLKTRCEGMINYLKKCVRVVECQIGEGDCWSTYNNKLWTKKGQTALQRRSLVRL